MAPVKSMIQHSHNSLAPAKINLFLHITGKRQSGYHDLQSLIFFVDVGDIISLSPSTAPHDTLIASGPFAHNLPVAEDNLILKAVRFYRNQFPELPPQEIHLTKNLPVASGIGGGTADAAAVLRLLASGGLTPPLPSAPDLTSLGAEFPVCYASQPTLVEGIGEQLTPFPALPQWGILLANPLKPLPTADVFKTLQPEDFTTPHNFTIPQTEAEWLALFHNTHNGMTRAATSLIPEIADMIPILAATPHCLGARMSGSGATCFGLYATRELAIKAAEYLQPQHPRWWIQAGGMWNGH